MSILMYKQRFRPPNLRKTPQCNYAHVQYIATRSGASKNEGMRHGLFGKLAPGNLVEFESWQQVAAEVRAVSHRKVNIFRSIISFTPQTTHELGLHDHQAWEDYVEKHIWTLARQNGISLKNLSWAAAHHNEESHPHVHIVFWDKNQKTMKNFVKPQVAAQIRIQLIKETFAERIQQYCNAKDKHKNELIDLTEALVRKFEEEMKCRDPGGYNRLKASVGNIETEEEVRIPIDQLLHGVNLSTLSTRLFHLKEMMPKTGRISYQFLPDDVKQEVDKFVSNLKREIPPMQDLIDEYAESKVNLSMLYESDPENIVNQREKVILEMDKRIANKLLGVVKGILHKESEHSNGTLNEAARAYYTEQMVCEILTLLERSVSDSHAKYEDRHKAMGTDLSKSARKELYLQNRDRGVGK